MLFLISLLVSVVVFSNFLSNEETIVGTVLVNEVDNEENVLSVGIQVTVVSEEEEKEEEENYAVTVFYIVADNEMGQELIEFVGETVEAVGVVTTDDDGNQVIEISSYTVIEALSFNI